MAALVARARHRFARLWSGPLHTAARVRGRGPRARRGRRRRTSGRGAVELLDGSAGAPGRARALPAVRHGPDPRRGHARERGRSREPLAARRGPRAHLDGRGRAHRDAQRRPAPARSRGGRRGTRAQRQRVGRRACRPAAGARDGQARAQGPDRGDPLQPRGLHGPSGPDHRGQAGRQAQERQRARARLGRGHARLVARAPEPARGQRAQHRPHAR